RLSGEVSERVDRRLVGETRAVVVAGPDGEQCGEVAAGALPCDRDAVGVETARRLLGHPGQDVLAVLDPGREGVIRRQSVRQADDHETASVRELSADVVAE